MNINSLISENPKRIKAKKELDDFLANLESCDFSRKFKEISDIINGSNITKEFYTKFVLNLYDNGEIFFDF